MMNCFRMMDNLITPLSCLHCTSAPLLLSFRNSVNIATKEGAVSQDHIVDRIKGLLNQGRNKTNLKHSAKSR